ncbi:MAG: zinc-ribbon domain-containing protein [Clostridiaceae bacterium]|nr:zinc-ribbon domain-containing protein [Clostridiaceae bacterium]
MLCPHCGYSSEKDFRFCPECGAPSASPQPADVPETSAQAYIRQDYDPCRDGHFPPGSVTPCPAPVLSGQQTVAPHEPRPSTTGAIVLSIVNMLCCGFGISMVLGLIALVFAIMASSEARVDEARKKIGWARTINIVGLVFVALQLLVIVLLIVGSIIWSDGGSWQGPGSFGGDFPLG